MVLKYAKTPQLIYGGQTSADAFRSRFPAGSQPAATCPEYTPVIAHEANGQSHYAMKRRDVWKKLAPFRDWRTGEVSWREDGTQLNVAAWSVPQQKK